MVEANCGLLRSEKILKRREFQAAYARGVKIHAACFVLYILRNDLSRHRLGLTVSRKIGPAVARNRIKRQLREAFRKNKSAVYPHCDVVVNARYAAATSSNRKIQEDLLEAMACRQRRESKS